MWTARIACIVEGHGEAGPPGGSGAAEILLRRIAVAVDQAVQVHVPLTLRIANGTLIKRGGVEDSVERAARKLGAHGAIFVLLDCDRNPRERLEVDLLSRAQQTRSDRPIAVVAAKCEFEAWFLAAAESLAGVEGLAADLQAPANPEEITNAKGWLKNHMAGRKYSETIHQSLFARRFDLQAARTSPSFAHCYDEIARLIKELRQLESQNTDAEGKA